MPGIDGLPTCTVNSLDDSCADPPTDRCTGSAKARHGLRRLAPLCIAVAWAAALALPLVWPVVRWMYPLPPPRPPGPGLAGLVGVLDVLAAGARAQFVLMVVVGGWMLSLLAAWGAARITRGGTGPSGAWRHRLPAVAATVLLALPLFVQAAAVAAPEADPVVAATGDR